MKSQNTRSGSTCRADSRASMPPMNTASNSDTFACARERAERFERRVADAAPRRGDRADERGIVVGVGDQAQIRADVLDLGLVEERLAAGQHVRNPLAAQHLFEDARLEVAAIQDRVVAKLRAPLELVRRQAKHDRFGLVLFVVAAA